MNCKITVMKMVRHDDLIEKYENPIEHTCDMAVGMVFESVDGKKPEGMCDSAWESMRFFVEELARGGGNFYDGWMKEPGSAMISCNDGFRPVSFYIETEEAYGKRKSKERFEEIKKKLSLRGAEYCCNWDDE